VRFVCDVSADLGFRVLLALNPVTKTEVKISPAFTWTTNEELEIFAQNFELFCQVSWRFGRLDPSKINSSAWPTSSIMNALLAGEEAPPPVPPPDHVERDEVSTDTP
jgi:hypothetical protein